jgi:hypothetical protein
LHLLRLLIELAIVGWLPGAVIFRLPCLERDRRAGLAAEERAFWAVIVSLAVSLSIVLALAVLHRYSFSRLLIADMALAAGTAALARGRLRFGASAPPPGLAAIVPVVIVLLGVWRFFPPAEYVIGGKDPGVYLNEGVQIAQRGAVVVHDPVVASVPPSARSLFFPSGERSLYPPLRFMGFWITNAGTGAVVGQFPHLFPASIAIGHGLAGLTGARATVGVWAILGIVAVYFAAARLAGRAAAAAAALLLVLHVIEVWFGRYPNAEVVMQTLLFAALLANARAHVDRDPFFAPLAGLLLAMLLFLRYDAVLAIAGVAAGLVLSTVATRSWPRGTFLVAFGIVGSLAALYLFGPMRSYMYLPIVFLSNLPPIEYAALAVTLVVALAAVALAARSPRLSAFVERWAPAVIVITVWLLALYALLLRQPAGKLAAHDANALRTFTYWYLTLPGLLAALLGFALIVRRRFWRDPALIVTIAVFACVLFFKIRIVPEHFWMTRRFLAAILPGSLVFAAAAALSGAKERVGPSLGRAMVGVVFIALLAFHYARASRPVMSHVEYAGLIPKLEALAGGIGDDDLAIVESRDTGSDVHVLGLPLAYIYARNVLVLDSARPDKPQFAEFLEWAHTRYRRVLFVGGGGTDLLSHRYGVRPVASERFQVPEYASLLDAYPTTVRRKEFEYAVYEFTGPRSIGELSFDLDVGVGDDLHVLRFHAKEQTEGRTFRWTRARSYVSVTVIHRDSREVTLWMSNGGRPPTAPPADVTVSLHGEVLGTVRVADGFAAYSLAIPPALADRAAGYGDPVELALTTTVWNPHDALGTNDDRDLGVMVDRVAVR